jgi:hypothetical protein
MTEQEIQAIKDAALPQHFYAASTGGFYVSNIHKIMPADAVKITQATKNILMLAQHGGQTITAGANGLPVATSRPVDPIAAAQHAYNQATAADIEYNGNTYHADIVKITDMALHIAAGVVPAGFYVIDAAGVQIPFTLADLIAFITLINNRNFAASAALHAVLFPTTAGK